MESRLACRCWRGTVAGQSALWHLAQPAGNIAFGIPVAERLGVAGEVTGIIACQLGHVDRLGDLAVQVIDRVVEQLDDVLGVVGEGAGILDGNLVVVGGLQAGGR